MNEGPDHSRIRPVKVRVRLPVSCDEAFAFISEPRNDPQWVDTTPHVTQVDGDGPVVGAVYEFEQTVQRSVTGTIRITDIAAPAFMAFLVEDPFRIHRIEYRLVPKGDGCMLEQATIPWFKSKKLRRRMPIVRLFTRKQLRKQMRALKAALTAGVQPVA